MASHGVSFIIIVLWNQKYIANIRVSYEFFYNQLGQAFTCLQTDYSIADIFNWQERLITSFITTK